MGDGGHVVAGLYKQNTVLLKPKVSKPHPHHLMVLENKIIITTYIQQIHSMSSQAENEVIQNKHFVITIK